MADVSNRSDCIILKQMRSEIKDVQGKELASLVMPDSDPRDGLFYQHPAHTSDRSF